MFIDDEDSDMAGDAGAEPTTPVVPADEKEKEEEETPV